MRVLEFSWLFSGYRRCWSFVPHGPFVLRENNG